MRLNPEDALMKLNLRLQAKYRKVAEKETLWEETDTADAEYLLCGFGLSARICRSAVHALRKEGANAGLFRPVTLWPFPEAALAKAAKGKKKLLVVEMNAGQMVEDVKLATGCSVPVDFLGTLGGITPQVDAIVERIRSYAC
jgi:2-oxoglutarate ferredoxin oxidoreductase subunit alpha